MNHCPASPHIPTPTVVCCLSVDPHRMQASGLALTLTQHSWCPFVLQCESEPCSCSVCLVLTTVNMVMLVLFPDWDPWGSSALEKSSGAGFPLQPYRILSPPLTVGVPGLFSMGCPSCTSLPGSSPQCQPWPPRVDPA